MDYAVVFVLRSCWQFLVFNCRTGCQGLVRRRFCRGAFADLHATRGLLLQASERASAILTARQILEL